MELFLDVLGESLVDTAKMLPFLFLAYLLIEYIETRHGERIEALLAGGGRWGAIPGAVLGCVPQCGFSAIASNFYSSRVITLGTLMAVYLATSDEAIPLLVSMPAYWDKLAVLMVIKVVYAIVVGFVLDFVLRGVLPKSLRGGYTGFWRASDVLEFTSHGYDGYVFDENNNRIDFKGYRADCITDLALEFFDQYDGQKPFFMTISHIEPHHQNDHKHYEGPVGSKEKYANYEAPADLAALGGDYKEEYPDYLGACAALDRNLGKVIDRLKKEGLYENTVIIFGADHGSHFKTRNRDGHLNGYDDYKRSGHDAALRVPLVIAGGPFKGGKVEKQIVSTASLPKTILALAGVDVGDKMIGENLADVVAGNTPNRVNEAFAQISESRCGRCIRTPDFLYAVYAPGVNGGEAAAADVYADDYLYDLKVDPVQLNNVVADPAYAEAKAMLRGRLLDWIKRAEGAEPTIVD